MQRRTFLAAATGALAGVAGCQRRAARDATPTSNRQPAGGTAGWRMADAGPSATRHNPRGTTTQPAGVEWRLSLGEFQAFSDPAVAESTAYLVRMDWRETPASTRLVAYALSDGMVEWQRALPYGDAFPPALGAVDGARAVFAASGQDNSNTGPGKGVVRAFDPASGDRLWSQPFDRQVNSPPVYADGRVVVTTEALGDGRVYGLDADSGERTWSRDTERDPHNAPTVADGRVFASPTREELAAFDAATGDAVWRVDARGATTRPVVNRADGLVYVGHRHGLEAFDAASGDRAWTFQATEPSAPSEDWLGVTTEPVVAGDTLYVETSDTSGFAVGDPGNLYALDAESGDRWWKLADGRPDSRIVGADGHALVARAPPGKAGTGPVSDAPDGELVCLAPDGSTQWTADAWAPIAATRTRLCCFRGSRWSSSPSEFAVLSA